MEPKYTLKINIRAQEEKEKRQKEIRTREAISKLQSIGGAPSLPRRRPGLNFHQPGIFVAQAEQLRRKAKLEALQKKIAASAAKTGIADAAKLASLTTSKVTEKIRNPLEEFQDKDEDVPELEWWDKAILGNQSIDQMIAKLRNDMRPEDVFHGITNLVEHPPVRKPPGLDTSNIPMPIFLTQKERKRLRRQNRRNQELEKQEKIKLGLVPKPEAKLKRSNIMYALGDEAITNPSMAEQLVRDQEEKRLKAHQKHNESKKLSLEDRKSKKMQKVRNDLKTSGMWVAVYRILNLSRQSRRLKIIDQKAKQLLMTGFVCLSKSLNLVIVEGAPKQQRKFKQLILNRLKWTGEPSTVHTTSKETVDPKNLCLLVWEGQVLNKIFNYFKIRPFGSESEARSYFREFNVEHYYDLAYKMSILDSISDT